MRAKSMSVVLAALAMAALPGCGGGTGGGEDGGGGTGEDGGGTSRPAPQRTYDKDHTRIRVAPGEAFSLKLGENPGTGYAWVVGRPAPDGAVVEQTGKRFEGSDPGRDGSGGTRFLLFRAGGEGRTSVRLRHCFRCGSPSERIDADHKVTKVTFDVTVRK